MITEGANRGHSGNSCAGLGLLSAVSISESSSGSSLVRVCLLLSKKGCPAK